ncbi:hypothetical protein ACB092_11G049700 [Castanea dentata]
MYLFLSLFWLNCRCISFSLFMQVSPQENERKMLKKKGSRNTMTLKDFHDGSIPTDLPLPFALSGSIPTERKREKERCLLLKLEVGYLGLLA